MTSPRSLAHPFSRRAAVLVPLMFALRAGAVFCILLFLWRWIQQAYAACFRVGAELASSLFFGDLVNFETRPDNPNGDTLLVVDGERCSLYVNAFLDSWFIAYLPTAMFLSLALALRRPMASLARTALWGLLWIHVYIALRVLVVGVSAFSGDQHVSNCGARHAIAMNQYWGKAWSVLERLLYQEPLVYMLIPSLIWVLVSFRARNWEALTMRLADSAPTRPRSSENPPER